MTGLVILNENDAVGVCSPGDLEAYPDAETLLCDLELWYADIPHEIFDADGREFRVVNVDAELRLVGVAGGEDRREYILQLVEAHALRVRDESLELLVTKVRTIKAPLETVYAALLRRPAR